MVIFQFAMLVYQRITMGKMMGNDCGKLIWMIGKLWKHLRKHVFLFTPSSLPKFTKWYDYITYVCIYIYRGCNMDTKWDMYHQLDMIWACPSIVRHLWENHIKFVGYLRHMLGCISLLLNIIWIFHGVLWDIFHQYHDWLVVYLPLWKIMEWKSVGMMKFPIYGKS